MVKVISALLVGTILGGGLAMHFGAGAIQPFAILAPAGAAGGKDDGHGHGGGGHGEGEEEGGLNLSAAQIEASGITLASAGAGELVRVTTFPGSITPNPDRMAVVSAKAAGVVVDLKKRLGETVAKGELLALIESREIAEARAELQAAQRGEALARTTFEREKSLWEKKISSEQDYLQARAALDEIRIRIDLARQKLAAFGFGQGDAKANGTMQVLEIRSPIAGRIVERRAVLGASVPSDIELFSIADLSVLWVEASIAPNDLAFVKEGNPVIVEAGTGVVANGEVVFVSPVIDRETRLAKVVAQIPNPDGRWRPGDFASVSVKNAGEMATVLVPREAIQRMKKESVVFVRTDEGFEKRDVVLGRSDGRQVEIRFGVDAGEKVAVANSFVLKAQLEKAEAEHSH